MIKTDKHEYTSRGNYVSDTETTVRSSLDPNKPVGTLSAVHTFTRFLPGLMSWTEPPASVMRGWVDEHLAGTGYRRDGQRVRGSFATNGWHYTYYVIKEGK